MFSTILTIIFPKHLYFIDFIMEEKNDALSSSLLLNSDLLSLSIHEPNKCLKRILSYFIFNSRPYKSSLFHTFIIRSIKRIYRCIVSNRIPKKTCIKVDFSSEIEVKYWNLFCSLYRENPEFFSKISKSTLIFPNRLNNSADHADVPLKYNIQTFSEFFSPELVRISYTYLVNLLFSSPAPDELAEKLNFKCCKNSNHKEECINKWNKLEDFLRNQYLSCFHLIEIDSNTDFHQDELNIDI